MSPDFSLLPSIDRVLTEPSVQDLLKRCDPRLLTDLARQSVVRLREGLRNGIDADRDTLVRQAAMDVEARLERLLAPRLRRVINATGIILHTNLGRAAIPKAAGARLAEVASCYTNLELDLSTGKRGSRSDLVEGLICDLTGAEAAAVVNNNAAAVLLALNTLSLGKEAIVSRGQLIEIGGAFRIPDIMSRSGAVMVEVGTTNRTHLRDFEDAISDETAVMLAVHPSNYRVQGFTSEVALGDLVALGRRRGIAVIHDLGGGVLVDLRKYGLPYEPVVSDSVEAGVDVVTFSGDKILGGPQSGLIVGKRDAVEAIRHNPLMRALRCGKLTYAALEETLKLYLDTARLTQVHPTLRMLTEPVLSVRRRARRLVRLLEGVAVEANVVDTAAQTGSGALPLEEIESVGVALGWEHGSTEALAERLRAYVRPVLGYVREDKVILDMRTVGADDIRVLGEAIGWAVAEMV